MICQLQTLGFPADTLVLNTYEPADVFLKIDAKRKQSQRFLAVGRFVENKAPENTIKVFAETLQVQANAYLNRVFDRSFRCKILANKINISQKIAFLGALPVAKMVCQHESFMAFVLACCNCKKWRSRRYASRYLRSLRK